MRKITLLLAVMAVFWMGSISAQTSVNVLKEGFTTDLGAWGFASNNGSAQTINYGSTNKVLQIRWTNGNSEWMKTLSSAVTAGTDNKVTAEFIIQAYACGSSSNYGAIYLMDDAGNAITGFFIRRTKVDGTNNIWAVGRATTYPGTTTYAYPSSADPMNADQPIVKITFAIDFTAKTVAYTAQKGTYDFTNRVFTSAGGATYTTYVTSSANAFINSAAANIKSLRSYYFKAATASNTPYNGLDLISANITKKVTTPPTLTGAAQASTICEGSTATINLTGMVANSTGNSIDYTIDGVAQTQITGVSANGSGNASFSTPILSVASHNGKSLVVTRITDTNGYFLDFSVSTTLVVTQNSVGGTAAADLSSVSLGGTTTIRLSGNTGTIQWQSSTDGTNYSDISGATSSTYLTPSLTPIGTYYYRAKVSTACITYSNAVTVTSSSNPVVNTSSWITGNGYFVQTPGSSSTVQTFTVSGTNLSGDITLTPPTNFEISTDNSNFVNSLSSLTLTQNSGVVNSTTVYVRLVPTAIAAYSGNIAINTTGGSTQNLAVSGHGLSAEPTTQTSAANTGSVLQTTMTLGWTVGSGAKSIVLYSTNSDVASTHPPLDGITYTAGNSITTGYNIGYVGTGNSLSLTGLSANTTYYIAVFTFDDGGVTGSENYNTISPAIITQTTPPSSVATDYFQSNTSGNWSTTTIWNSSTNNSTWHIADLAPGASTGNVSIITGHTITVTASPGSTGLSLADGSTVSLGANSVIIPSTTFAGTTAVIDAGSYSGTKVSGFTVSNANIATFKGSCTTSNSTVTGTFDAVGSLASGSELILNGTNATINTENKFGITSAPTSYLANVKVTLKGKAFLYINANQSGSTTINVGTLSGESGTKLGWGGSTVFSRDITWSVGGSNQSSEFAGTLTNIGMYHGGGHMYFGNNTHLIKVGTGTLTLSGTSTDYNGNLTVNGGEVIISGAVRGNNQPAIASYVSSGITYYTPGPLANTVTVSGTQTKLTVNGILTATTISIASTGTLQGTGSVTGTTTVNGTIAGALNFNSNVTLSATALVIAGTNIKMAAGTTLTVASGTAALDAVTINTNGSSTGVIALPDGATIPTLTITSTSAPAVGTNIQVVNATAPGSIIYTNTPVVPVGYSFDTTTGILTYNGTTITTDTNISSAALPGNASITVNTGNTLIIDQNTSANIITAAPGAKVTLNSGKTLIATTVTLQSGSSGTATFVDNGTATITTATVQQYLPQGRNWYVGIPFTNASAISASSLTATGLGTSVAYYDEPNSSWGQNYTGTLARGVGYIAVSGPSDGSATNNVSFSGTLNTGSVPVALTRQGATKTGFNLIANPYPSYLNAMAAINANANMEQTIWYRTRSTGATPTYYFETVNTASGIGTNDAGTGQATGYVPPMQAFWVRTLTDGNSITFNNSMRYHAGNVVTDAGTVPTTVMKAPSGKQSVSRIVRLQVSNGINSDETVIYTNDNAANGFDPYDSQKMSNANVAIPEIYSVVGNENLVINGLNSIQPNMEIPLGFTTGQSNSFTIKASEISNLDEGTKLILRDNQLLTEQELTTANAYSFSTDAVTTTSRFSILFKTSSVTTGTNAAGNNQSIEIYRDANNQITISCESGFNSNAVATIYNVLGQELATKQLLSNKTVFENHLISGTYTVSVNNGDKRTTTKIVIN